MKKLLLSAAFVLAAAQAPAATVSYSDSHAATTNWTTVLSLPKFDPALGLLQQVQLDVGGEISTLFKFENMSLAPRSVSQSSTATLAFSGPVSATLVVPLSISTSVAAMDSNGLDYAGPAGYTQLLQDSRHGSFQWLVGADDLSAFIGAGLLDLSVTATGVSTGTSGSRRASIATQAGATARISYAYSPAQAVPEPGSLALACMALGVFALLRRRA